DALLHLPSFPTRRSSDLDADRTGVQHLRARPRARAPDRARLADPLTEEAAPDPGDRGGDARVHRPAVRARGRAAPGDPATVRARSEEHTSELQSRGHLVC